jgi:hypothetical protein
MTRYAIKWFIAVALFPWRLSERYLEIVKKEAGILDPGTLIAIGISLAISAISYGIQALLAPKPPPQVGPRLDDLGNPTTNPGKQIPKATGRNITTGQLIWTTGLIETKHVDKVSGGKGGGGSQKVITYTYSISIALAFNDGEICGVQRILANGAKPIWSNKLLTVLTAAEITAAGQAEYDAVYADRYAYWIAQGESASTANKRAKSEAKTARKQKISELEAQNDDVQPRYDSIEFYYGTETQLPSPTIEAVEGVGNVPAYRGTAYLVINNLQLGDFGNFVPSFTIDYATAGETSDPTAIDGTFSVGTAINNASVPDYSEADGVADDNWAIDFTARRAYITGFSAGSDRLIFEFNIDTLEFVKTHKTGLSSLAGAAFLEDVDPVTGYIIGRWWGFTSAVEDWVYDPATETLIAHNTGRDEAAATNFGVQTSTKGMKLVYSPSATVGRVLSIRTTDGTIATHDFPTMSAASKTAGVFGTSNVYGGFVLGAKGEAFNVAISASQLNIIKFTLTDAGLETLNQAYDIILPSSVGNGGDWNTTGVIQCWYAGADSLIISARQLSYASPSTTRRLIFKWTVGAAAPDWEIEVPYSFGSEVYPILNSSQSGPNERFRYSQTTDLQYLILRGSSSTSIWKIKASDGSYTIEESTVTSSIDFGIWDDVEGCLYGWDGMNAEPETSIALYSTCWNAGCLESEVTLGDVIRNFMNRSGFASTEYEVAAGLDLEYIWGFSDNSGRSTRDVLEDLARIRPVIVNEIEGKLRFALADSATVATIPLADVRAYDGQAEPPQWISEVTTFEDLALPKQLRITYQDYDRALNPTTAIFTREVTQSKTINEFAVQAVDTAPRMRESVFRGMSLLLSSKRTFKLSVPAKYLRLEPGDVISIPISDTRTATARVEQAVLGANNVVELECSLYVATDLGITHTDQFDTVDTDDAPLNYDTNLYVIDTPYLRDAAELNSLDEEDNGVYIGFGALQRGWPGANLYVDRTSLTTETAFGEVTQATGGAEWELFAQSRGSVAGGNISELPDPDADALVIDTVSELVVAFETVDASFDSLSDTAVLSSQENVFLVGDEILQAQTCELLYTFADGRTTWKFTNLYRGLQGTEWAIGTQAEEDVVVHLDPNALSRIDLENDDLRGLTVGYRAVTVNSDITAVATQGEVYTAASRLPWAPSIEEVVRDGSGNLTFVLYRRNRYGSDWTPADPSFTTDPQTYEVDVIGGGSVLRTISVSGTDDVSYTAAEQTTDFGSAQSAILVRAYQLDSAGRRGFAREETI